MKRNLKSLALINAAILSTSLSVSANSGELLSSNNLLSTNTLISTNTSSSLTKIDLTKTNSSFNLVANSEKNRATLVSNGVKTTQESSSSFHFNATAEDLKRGIIYVSGANIAAFGVDQKSLSGKEPKGNKTGVVGFSLSTEKENILKYDPLSGSAKGRIYGYADYPQLGEFAKPLTDDKRDNVIFPRQAAYIDVSVKFARPLNLDSGQSELSKTTAQISARAIVLADRDLGLPQYSIGIQYIDLPFVIGPVWRFSLERRLCVQPVKIAWWSYNWLYGLTYNSTGSGLAFGTPGATTQWKKANVAFNVRSWKTLFGSTYTPYVTSTTTEAANLKNFVNDDDCVEVFFVGSMSPEGTWGGGATWGSGSASAKIVSSDRNAYYGIDQTHLAHELGHALSLLHPPGNSSTGTLMCPSGFKNDNPKVNSKYNENNVSNPLLTYHLIIRNTYPDCQNDADCGSC